MRRAFFHLRNKVVVALTALTAAMVVSVPVHAALPAEATAAFTTLGTDATSLLAAGWPIIVIVVGGLVVMKLFRKVISKAT